MIDTNHDTLTGVSRLEQDVRKSRFLAIAAPVANVDEAMAFLAEHHIVDATHNCWAYKIGNQYRFNDDGEPSGTAGKPILQAIEGQGLDAVMVLVVRWFGGIKLGAGGLVRAYGGAAAECLRVAPKRHVVARTRVHLMCTYSEQGAVRQRLAASDASEIDQTFEGEGVCFSARIPLDQVDTLRLAVADITRGRSQWRDERTEPEG